MGNIHEWDQYTRDAELDPEDEIAMQLAERIGAAGPDLVKRLRFGMDVQEFLRNSDIGQYLVSRAQEQYDIATVELVASNNLTTTQAHDLHIQAKVADAFISWLGEAIQDGLDAEKLINEEDET